MNHIDKKLMSINPTPLAFLKFYWVFLQIMLMTLLIYPQQL